MTFKSYVLDQFAPSRQTFTQRALVMLRHVKLSRQRKDGNDARNTT
jgi:hypothetical protein